MVVDGSVLLTVLLRTRDAARFDAALFDAPVRLISEVTRAEVACMVTGAATMETFSSTR